MFNQALLAKQGWRLVQYLESLVARVLRDKYYPLGEFLQAHLGRRPSYAWQSIFQARGLLEEGLMWQAGNGEKIRIWGDKSLPPPNSTLLYNPHQRLDVDARVCNLLDLTSGWWNLATLQELFSPEEANKILGVVPSPLKHPDQLIWRGFKNGMFTVKSAYHLEKQIRAQAWGERSTAGEMYTVWKSIWSMQMPDVVKNFLWKVGNNLLPTKSNLLKKRIVEDSACPICLQLPEDTFHILWRCPSATAVWQKCVKKI
jgi:hypothetical protein